MSHHAFDTDFAPMGLLAPEVEDDIVVDGYDLGCSLAAATNRLAAKRLTPAERAWKDQYLTLLANYPQLEVRIGLAARGSLTMARTLVHDRSIRVRRALAVNPFIADLDLQTKLAQDRDESVVLALIDATDPWMEACEVILTGQHGEAKRELVRRKNLRTELLVLARRQGVL
jgi:hypothetical protein